MSAKPSGLASLGGAADPPCLVRESPPKSDSPIRNLKLVLSEQSESNGSKIGKMQTRPRRESNPHLRFRKPSFFPLNYGDDDLEGIDELNGDGQAAVAVRSDLSRTGFALDYRQLSRDYHSHTPVGALICPLRLKKRFSSRSG